MVNILALADNVSEQSYSKNMLQLIRSVKSTSNKSLIVSLNKSYKSILYKFENENLNPDNFVFIDAITLTVMKPTSSDKCTFLSSPDNTKELFESIIKTIKTMSVSVVIFDSISSLSTYKNIYEVIDFIGKLTGACYVLGCSVIFFCLDNEENERIIQHLGMHVDKIYDAK